MPPPRDGFALFVEPYNYNIYPGWPIKIHRTEKNTRILSSDLDDCGARSLPALRPLVIEKSAALVYRDVLAPRAKNPTSLEGGYVAYERERLLGGRGRPEVRRLEPADKVLFVGVES